MRARCDRCSSLAEQIELRNRVRDPRGRHVIANVADLRPSERVYRAIEFYFRQVTNIRPNRRFLIGLLI